MRPIVRTFDYIYNLYWEKLFLYVVKVIKNENEAQDIVQEIFISLWRRREQLENIESLPTYLFTAARYKSFTYIRENLKKNNYEISLSEHLSVSDNSLQENYNAKELAEIIDGAIEKLPSKMKQIYILSRKENLSHKEISKKLDISEKTVKKQVGNALKYFRIKLNGNYPVDLLILFSIAIFLH